ncbi:purine-binding chemotaxis protein CheW [Methanocalculus alkaliphilus]|uniref:chemotaxis protein CheW n=1 Tax=Methanocalculus alkaliphilus TaxID=768730 RepID=UPI0020A1F66F|nr:chemotaxis protein CheW [Methanocalculus alkaliphilus]MCP1714437.1 purine-binding chemotaxis protein CheW [Methanocalculus alkaliphilus]
MVREAEGEDAMRSNGSIQVMEYTRISALPNSPSYIKGIIDLHGEITTINDLKARLNILGSDRAEEESRIIVVDENITNKMVGIMVDDVLSVSTFEMSYVDRTGAVDSDDYSCTLGIIKKKSQAKDKEATDLVIWIDIKQLLGEMLSG